VRFRPVMLLAVLAKASFVGALVTLLVLGRIGSQGLGFAALDATFVVLFLVAYARRCLCPSAALGPDRERVEKDVLVPTLRVRGVRCEALRCGR
jgi:hypothetical protein